MKRMLAILLASALGLALCACAKKAPVPSGTDGVEPVESHWYYAVETEISGEEYTAADGTPIGSTSYETPRLTLGHQGVETTPPAEMQAVCDAFNDGVGAPVPAEWNFEEIARAEYEWRTEAGLELVPISDEFDVTDTLLSDTMLSVIGVGSSYTGGAHPNNYFVSWNFDLQNARFFTLNDLSGDPAALRAAVTENIIAQIKEQGLDESYFPDYAETIRATEDFHVHFGGERKMTVWFSEYDIAPHAAGIPMFDVPHAVLEPYLNDYGAALLGVVK